MSFEVYEVEADAAARIAVLDASAYKQGNVAAEWRESTQAATADGVSYATSHLSFSAFVTSSPAVSPSHQMAWTTARVRSRLLVEYLFHLRPGQQISDSRLSARAAGDIRRAIMAPSSDYNAVLFDAGRVQRTSDGEWLLVQVEFDVFHDVRS